MDTERDSEAAFELAAGCGAVVVVAFAAALLFGPAEQIARAVVVAIAVGVLAVLLHDWRASAGVTVLAALVFVGFLAHQHGQLTGDPSAWRYTVLIGLAALLGRADIDALLTPRAGRSAFPSVRLFRNGARAHLRD